MIISQCGGLSLCRIVCQSENLVRLRQIFVHSWHSFTTKFRRGFYYKVSQSKIHKVAQSGKHSCIRGILFSKVSQRNKFVHSWLVFLPQSFADKNIRAFVANYWDKIDVGKSLSGRFQVSQEQRSTNKTFLHSWHSFNLRNPIQSIFQLKTTTDHPISRRFQVSQEQRDLFICFPTSQRLAVTGG